MKFIQYIIDWWQKRTRGELSEDELRRYIVKNSDYYEKYIQSFNKIRFFISWNTAVFFFSTPWLIYRKIYWPILFTIPITLACILVVSAKIKGTYLPDPFGSGWISPHSDAWMLAVALFLLNALTLALFVNNAVLYRAFRKQGTYKKGKTSFVITLCFSTLLSLPGIYFIYDMILYEVHSEAIDAAYSLNKYYSHQTKDYPFSGMFNYEREGLIEDAKAISPEYLKIKKTMLANVPIEGWFVCFDDIEIIEILENNGIELTQEHLEKSSQCNAGISQWHLKEKLQSK